MTPAAIASHFSGSYIEARHKFLAAAADRGAPVESHVLPVYQGALGEELAVDVACLGPVDAGQLLILSSGTHGPEGFCGSGCQVAALRDDDFIAVLQRFGVRLLLIHAINPYGFSHMLRNNQDNVDLNRNHIDFGKPLPANTAYDAVDLLALPDAWPPTEEDERALEAYIEQHGVAAFHAALSAGQYHRPSGMFYGGRHATWNNNTVRDILRRHATGARHIGWIDVHTGLGPNGHGEKIYAGRTSLSDLALARSWWGADVFAPFEGQSESPEVSGPVAGTVYDECPDAAVGLIALEIGTVPFQEIIFHLRACQWLIRHPEAPAQQQREIRQNMRDAYYCDNDAWKGAVWGQARTSLVQAVTGLSKLRVA